MSEPKYQTNIKIDNSIKNLYQKRVTEEIKMRLQKRCNRRRMGKNKNEHRKNCKRISWQEENKHKQKILQENTRFHHQVKKLMKRNVYTLN